MAEPRPSGGFYVKRPGRNLDLGPYDLALLKREAADGHVAPSDLIWVPNRKEWVQGDRTDLPFAPEQETPTLAQAVEKPAVKGPIIAEIASEQSPPVTAEIVAKQPRRKTKFSKQNIQTVALRAQRLADVINESMQIAKESRNASTKLSRLDFAKQKIGEIKELASDYPFLELTTLKKVEACLAQLEIEFKQAIDRGTGGESLGGGDCEEEGTSADEIHTTQGEIEARGRVEKIENWVTEISRQKEEGSSTDVIRECRKRIPVPYAFTQIAIAIRKDIRARRKAKKNTKPLLLKLYHWAVVENFFDSVNWGSIINDRILFSTARPFVRGVKAPYETIGYHNLALLKKTDVKWLVEAFGEPVSHSSARDANLELWREAVEAFRLATIRDKKEFYGPDGYDIVYGK